MSNQSNEISDLLKNIINMKEEIRSMKQDESFDQLNNLLEQILKLANKTEPLVFNNFLDDYKNTSNILETAFLDKFNSFLNSDNFKSIYSGGNIKSNTDLKKISLCNQKTSENNNVINANTEKGIFNLKFSILKNNIEILRSYINSERNRLQKNITSIKNNEQFAITLNSDYSNIFKYRYLRNWGIFLSLVGGIYILRKIK